MNKLCGNLYKLNKGMLVLYTTCPSNEKEVDSGVLDKKMTYRKKPMEHIDNLMNHLKPKEKDYIRQMLAKPKKRSFLMSWVVGGLLIGGVAGSAVTSTIAYGYGYGRGYSASDSEKNSTNNKVTELSTALDRNCNGEVTVSELSNRYHLATGKNLLEFDTEIFGAQLGLPSPVDKHLKVNLKVNDNAEGLEKELYNAEGVKRELYIEDGVLRYDVTLSNGAANKIINDINSGLR